MQQPPEEIDWSLCTPEGAEREQLRVWAALPIRKKLEAVEEMADHARRTVEERRRLGLPYFDPFTGELVSGQEVD